MGSEHHVLSYSTTVLLVYLVSGVFFVLLVILSTDWSILIGRIIRIIQTPALLCHQDAQGKQIRGNSFRVKELCLYNS